MGRTNKAEMEKRIAVVERLLVEGKKSGMIVQVISQKYNISERMAWKYIKKAWERIKASYEKDRRKLLGFHTLARLRLYEKAFNDGKIFTGLQIIKDLADLQGLYVNKVAFTDPQGEKDYGGDFTEDELKRRVLAVLGVTEKEFDAAMQVVKEQKSKGVKK